MTTGHIPESRAAVMVAAGRTEVWTVPASVVDPEGAVLRVRSAGVCGSDVSYYRSGVQGDGPYREPPLVLGHEIVGALEWAGSAAERWGVEPGAQVVVSPVIHCGACGPCRAGRREACERPTFYGMSYGASAAPALRGGNAQYLDVHPNSRVYQVPDGVPAHLASLYVAIANGLDWVGQAGRVVPGETVVVIGPGQHGLGCVLAAATAGAGRVILAGLSADRHRLEVGRALGATDVVEVDETDLGERVRELTLGAMAPLVVEVSGSVPGRQSAFDVVGPSGRIVLAGLTGGRTTTHDLDRVVRREVTVVGVHAHRAATIPRALELIAAEADRLQAMVTHVVGLDHVGGALTEIVGADRAATIHVTVDPWA